MADGCLSNVVKYALFLTNFLIFVSILQTSFVAFSVSICFENHNDNFPKLMGVAVLGCGIWVLVDKPNFLDLFEQVFIT